MPVSRSSVHLDVAPDPHRSIHVVEPDPPFKILVIGDFSGRRNRGVCQPLEGRYPFQVDRDTAGEVLDEMHPALKLSGISLHFGEIDDFHPDQIWKNGIAFPAPPALPRSGGSLLESMLEESGEDLPTPPSTPELTGDLSDYLRKIVRPHLAPKEDPHERERKAKSAETAGEAMKAILHHPDFQALEAAWRAVWMLVRGLETGGALKIYLFDATREELAGDPSGAEELFAGTGEPWAIAIANFTFNQSKADTALLARLGKLAWAARCPFIAEAEPPAEPSPEWDQLRHSPEARWIGLALPRFLLRLPYGAVTSPVESFPFEEMTGSVHQDYLWGNPAFCCAYLLGQAFIQDGWDFTPGSVRRIDGMPLHVYKQNGESLIKPCAEVLLTEKQADFLLEAGIMPLASLKDQDAVLLVRFQSIAKPAAALAGRWTA